MSAMPIVYLPGGGGRSSFWRPVADRLSFRGAPIVFGYPGFGDVPPAPEMRSLSDLHDGLLRVLPPSFDLVAQSMGNVLAMRIAIEHPDRVRRLVLTAVSGGVPTLVHGAAEWREPFQVEHPGVPSWFVDDATDLTDRLPTIAAPTLLLFGTDDPLAPAAIGEFLRSRIPRATLHVIAGGHGLANEQPDLVARLIGHHLA